MLILFITGNFLSKLYTSVVGSVFLSLIVSLTPLPIFQFSFISNWHDGQHYIQIPGTETKSFCELLLMYKLQYWAFHCPSKMWCSTRVNPRTSIILHKVSSIFFPLSISKVYVQRVLWSSLKSPLMQSLHLICEVNISWFDNTILINLI